MDKIRRSISLGALLTCVIPVREVLAQDAWPSHSINYIVASSPGGGSDIIARILAPRLTAALGANVVVSYKPGAGGNIGANAVAHSAPDGYTIGSGSIATHAINVSLYPQLPHDTVKDFSPIALVVSNPNILIVSASSPFQSVRDIISAAKAKPGTIPFASAGIGTSQHLSGELFKLDADIDLINVPYKGAGPALQSVVAGETALSFENSLVAAAMIRSGRVRALAVTSKTRSKSFPDVPTMIEAGVPDYDVVSWQAVYGPAGIPQPIIERLSTEILAIIKVPEVQAQFAELGVDPVGLSPKELAAFQKTETEKWARVIKAANIRME